MRLAFASEPVDRIQVCVTFLRMDGKPATPARPLPEPFCVARVDHPTVPFYRYLYNTVGAAHLWWLRRVADDKELAEILNDGRVSIHVLYAGGAPAGFYEFDRRNAPDINLSYFGLLPHHVGTGIGTAFLRHAIDTGWAEQPRGITVNTCTADNPRALPGYLRAGFQKLREARELWSIPTRLGLAVPPGLRVG
jgi:GNAT superfamily N-acetyltransferase